jgi:hypothetical protein
MTDSCTILSDPNFWVAFTAICTLILAGVTAWLGFETRNVAKSTRAALELENEPYLFFEKIDFASLSNTGVQLSFYLFNSSKVPVEYKCNNISGEIEHIKLTWNKTDMSGMGAIIAQTKTSKFVIPLTSQQEIFSNYLSFSVDGVIEFDFSYWRMDNPNIKKKLSKKIRVIAHCNFHGMPNTVDFFYID